MSNLIPCSNNFEKLSHENPKLLLEWINSNQLNEAHLSFALEYLGENNFIDPLETLMYYLKTSLSPIVREGGNLWNWSTYVKL